ncbi:MAG: hypothetical protein ABI670_01800 [Chloroflexota bacterium]
MNHNNDSTATDLYLVRIWRARPGETSPALHGKLQHVVSGASCHFEGLSALPEALAKMMEESASSFGLDGAEPPTP